VPPFVAIEGKAIPREDELFTVKVGFDLADVQFRRAAGGGHGPPQLEGVKINNHWAIIYSKFDIGCALENSSGIDCKGYTRERGENRGQHRRLRQAAVNFIGRWKPRYPDRNPMG
jgi:hypothetical protein